MKTRGILLAAWSLTAAACVSTGKYDAAVADASKAPADLEAARSDATRNEKAAREQTERDQSDLSASRSETQSCKKSLDDATALNQQLDRELKRRGADTDQLLSAKGALAASLEEARGRLDELRRAEAAAQARSALFQQLALRLERMIDVGDLQIALRSGRMVLELPNDVLFDSGKAEIKPRGKEALGQVATALASFEGRRFQVAGHTDDVPIRHSGFTSNWQLSAERAIEVVEFMVQAGMKPDALSAAGYGEFDPIADNGSAEGKAKNRRIEITLQPNIDEFVSLPPANGG